MIVDCESCTSLLDASDWMLTKYKIQYFWKRRSTYLLVHSWEIPELHFATLSIGNQCLISGFKNKMGYAFPLWTRFHMPSTIQNEEAFLVLVHPLLLPQAWSRLLFVLVVDIPRIMKPHSSLKKWLIQQSRSLWRALILSAWRLSGQCFRGFSDMVAGLLLDVNRASQVSAYQSTWNLRVNLCSERDSNTSSNSICDILWYLADLHKNGYVKHVLSMNIDRCFPWRLRRHRWF